MELGSTWQEFVDDDIEKTPLNAGLIGGEVFAGITFQLKESMNLQWRVTKCVISENVASNAKNIAVIKNGCFSELVEAGLVAVDKSVRQRYNEEYTQIMSESFVYKYKAFGFSSSGSETQKLTCDIEFCVPEDDGDDGDGTSCVPAWTLGDCPDHDVFNYTPFGKAIFGENQR